MIANDRADLRRWTACAVLVIAMHALLATILVMRHDPIAAGEPSTAIMVDLSPFTTPPSESVEDIAPGPKQQEADAPPPEQQRLEQPVEEKIDLPPAPAPPVEALPPPTPENPEPPAPTPVPPAPATTAPPRAHASQAAITSWHSRIAAQIERHKAYPRGARARGETGIVQLRFSIDREGHIVTSEIARSSGHASLDQETLATLQRAEPFPAPPVDLAGDTFGFTVPVTFDIK
jgi:protein TonB